MSSLSPKSLPSGWYRQQHIYDLECEHIFSRHWWMVTHADLVENPGDYIATTISKWPVVVVRDKQGDLKAFHNVCRHRAGPLLRDGNGQCNQFVCRYHAWRYDTAGNLLKTPGLRANEEIDYNKFSLFPLRVECWNRMVFICFDDTAADLQAWLGDITEIARAFPDNQSMSFLGDTEKSAPVNWKTYGDNSCEGYHVGMVHSDLGDSMMREKVSIAAYHNGEFVGFDVSYESTGGDHTRDGKGFWIYKFPGLLLHFSEYGFNVESVIPLAVNRITLKRWFWVDADQAVQRGIEPSQMQISSEKVMAEDLEICELVQRNLDAGVYQSGHLSPQQETGTIYFQELVRRVISPYLR